MFIYKLTFASGKVYIGQTIKTVEHRFNHHRNCMSAGSKIPVHAAWRKHGEPTVECLGQYPDLVALNAAEVAAIAAHGSIAPGGYNIALGGDNNGTSHPLARAKMSASSTGKVATDETRAKVAAASKAHWEDPAYREKVLTGVAASFTPERRASMSEVAKRVHTGRKKSPEHVAKMKARIVSAETRAKMSAAAKGKPKAPRSEETKAKLAANTKAFWADPARAAERAAQIAAGHAANPAEERSTAARRAWETKRKSSQETN